MVTNQSETKARNISIVLALATLLVLSGVVTLSPAQQLAFASKWDDKGKDKHSDDKKDKHSDDKKDKHSDDKKDKYSDDKKKKDKYSDDKKKKDKYSDDKKKKDNHDYMKHRPYNYGTNDPTVSVDDFISQSITQSNEACTNTAINI